MERVIFGGVDITEGFAVADVRRPLPYVSSEFEHVPGRDGLALKSADILPSEIRFSVLMMDADEWGRRAAARELGPVLLGREPVEVSFSSDDGLCYVAVPTGAMDFSEFVRCGKLDVRLQPLDAAMYGAGREVTVPSGGSVTFTVGGTYPTRPTISAASAVRDSVTLMWGLELDGVPHIHVRTGSASARAVSIDCAERVSTVAGAASMITLDSDWLELSPGEHTIEMDYGTGAATVTFRERWL